MQPRTDKASKACKAVRRFCLDCQGDSPQSVRECVDVACLLYPCRLATLESLPENIAVLRVIRTHCLSCAGTRQEVRQCDARENCSLWSFRFGVLPATFKRVAGRQKKARETLLLPGLGPQ